MNILRFFQFHTRRGAEAIELKFRQMKERYDKFGLETGWLRTKGEELAQRIASALASARAELVLLQHEVHGESKASSASLRTQLRELLPLRSAVPYPAGPVSGNNAARPCWRFDWRRALAITLWAALIGLVIGLRHTHDVRLIYAVIACVAGLLILGPWPLSGYVTTMASCASKAAEWLRCSARAFSLEWAIYRRERKLVQAGEREARATQWVEERLGLVRYSIEVQRGRAEAAARLLVEHQHTLERQEEVFDGAVQIHP